MIKLVRTMKEIEKISGRDNRRLVDARKVRDGKMPGHIFVEGRRLVEEALRSNITINEGFFVEGFDDDELLEAVMKRTPAMARISEKLFASIADTDHPQGIILIANRPATASGSIESRLRTTALPVVIFLNEINNPSNLGAIFRTAEAADAAGVIISKNSADVFSPKAIRSAMGSSFRVPVWEHAAFSDVMTWAKERRLITTATRASAARNYTRIDWKTPRLLIFGSEAHGLGHSELERVEEITRIPMDNDVESLNLAVSAGIVLFEARRQNGRQ